MNQPLRTADLSPATPASAGRRADQSAWRRVVDGVVRGVEEGRLAPGQRLVEAELRLRFGVGRNAVREALQRLASDGVVELSRHRGASIRSIPPEQALSTLEITELLVGLAARAAARHGATPEARAVVSQALERLDHAVQDDDDRRFIKARGTFYDTLLAVGRNEELQRILPTVQVHVLRAQYHLTRLHRRLHDDYRVIGEAIMAGDAARAEQAGRAHVRRVRALIQKTIEQQED